MQLWWGSPTRTWKYQPWCMATVSSNGLELDGHTIINLQTSSALDANNWPYSLATSKQLFSWSAWDSRENVPHPDLQQWAFLKYRWFATTIWLLSWPPTPASSSSCSFFRMSILIDYSGPEYYRIDSKFSITNGIRSCERVDWKLVSPSLITTALHGHMWLL